MSQQPIRVAVLGAAGRMGRILSSMFARDARFELVARVDRHRREESMGVCMPSIIEDLNDAPKFDVLVDFSTPEATESALDIVDRRGVAWLVATTGVGDEVREKIESLGAKQPIFIAANTSLGIALMQRLALRYWQNGIAKSSKRIIATRSMLHRGLQRHWLKPSTWRVRAFCVELTSSTIARYDVRRVQTTK